MEGPVFWNQIPNLTAVLYTAKKYDSLGGYGYPGSQWSVLVLLLVQST